MNFSTFHKIRFYYSKKTAKYQSSEDKQKYSRCSVSWKTLQFSAPNHTKCIEEQSQINLLWQSSFTMG